MIEKNTVLSSAGGVNINAGNSSNLYTVPGGKKFKITDVLFTTDSTTAFLVQLQVDTVTICEGFLSLSTPLSYKGTALDIFAGGQVVRVVWPTVSGKNGTYKINGVETDDPTISASRVTTPGTNKLSAPTYSPTDSNQPSAGALAVTMTAADSGAHIFFTKDGTDPTHSGDTATGTTTRIGSTSGTTAIPTSPDGAVTTIKSVSYKSGSDDSDIAVKIYTVTAPSPPSGGGGGHHPPQ